MRITGVRVEISKTVSDGHYGNERYNAQYIAELDEGEDADEAIRILSQRGRERIIGQLAESESASIRYAINPPRDVNAQDICPLDGEDCPHGPTADECCQQPRSIDETTANERDAQPDDIPF